MNFYNGSRGVRWLFGLSLVTDAMLANAPQRCSGVVNLTLGHYLAAVVQAHRVIHKRLGFFERHIARTMCCTVPSILVMMLGARFVDAPNFAFFRHEIGQPNISTPWPGH